MKQNVPVIKLVAFVAFMLLSLISYAQPGGDPGGGDPDVPLTGIEYLLGGGLLIGARAMIARFKSKKQQ